MAFNINAQVVLSGPKNLNKITKQISSQLGKSGKLNINIGNANQLSTISKQLKNISQSFTTLNSTLKSARTSISALNSSFNKVGNNVNSLAKSQSNLQTQTNNANSSLKTQAGLVNSLGKRLSSVAKQAIAFGLISRPIYDLQRAFVGATKDAVQFQKEIVKISQVTGTSVQNLTGLSNEINRLATTLGVSANELAETSRIIAQTGRSAAEIQPILNALARSTLAPTFGKITDTTEGLIAALGQFQLEASQSEQILGSLNRVSKNFAVEAEDLISVIRRTGGVFAQAAGDSRNTVQALQELAAIFTAVRSTTRESADTIAAGLRTIFSRIQRRGTIEFLEQFGVQLTNVKGEFIGIFPAFDELSKKLSTLIQQGDALTLSAIAEELGGIRQIGKLLPAIAQFDKARAALEQAQKGAVEGLGIDVAKGLDTVDNRIKRVKESFDELIRTVFESDSFQNFTKGILTSAESILQFGTKVVESLEPILPLLQGIGAVKLGQAIGGFVGGGGIGKVADGLSGQAAAQASQAAATASQSSAQATQANTQVLNTINSTLQRTSNQLANIFQSLEGNFRTLTTQMSNLIQALAGFKSSAINFAGPITGGRRKSGGGKILGFNRGGMVPGTGSGDTVPAMLEPGEFVIKKSSVNSLGTDTLQAMNENRFNDGTPRTGVRSRSNRVVPSTSKGRTAAERAARNREEQGQGDANEIKSASFSGKFGLSVLEGSIPLGLSANIRDVLREAPAAGKQRLLDGLKKTGKGIGRGAKIEATNAKTAGLSDRGQQIFQDEIFSGIPKIFDEATKSFTGTELDPGTVRIEQLLSNSAIGSIKGQFFEAFVRRITGNVLADNTTDPIFDFETVSNIEDFKTLFGGVFELPNEFKNIANSDNIASAIGKGLSLKSGSRLQFKNSGGSISGQDTVPALLTPGEFVFNKKAAGRIGYSTLNAMNKKGVQGFNKGGTVGVQRFVNGGLADPRGSNVNALLEDIKDSNSGDGGDGGDGGDAKAAGNALSDLAGVAVSASFAVSSLTAAFEDGKLTTDELFNSALLLAPVIPAISSTMTSLKPSFEKFKTELKNTRGALAKTKKALSGTGGKVAAGGLALAGAALTTVEGEGSGAITARGAGAGLTAGFGAAALGIPAPIAAVIGLSAGLFSTLDGFIKASSPLPNALNELSKSSKEAAENLDKISVKNAGELSAKIFEDVGDVLSAQTKDLTLGKATSAAGRSLGLGFTSESAETRGVSQGIALDFVKNALVSTFTGQGPAGAAVANVSSVSSRLGSASEATQQEFSGAVFGDIAESFAEVDKIAAPAVKALTKALSEIDASPADSIDEFRTILDKAGISADSANTILTTVSKTGLNDLTDRLKDVNIESGTTKNRINGLLNELANSKTIEDFNKKLGQLDGVIRESGEESLKDFSAEAIVTGAALDTLNSTLNTSEKTVLKINEALNKFNNNLQSITDQLSFGLNKISTQTDNFQKRVNAIFAGTGELTIGRSVSGFAAGAGEADRAASFARLGAASTGDISGLETILRGVQDLPNIGEEFLRGTQANTTSPTTFAQNFAEFFQSRLPGVEVPDALVNSIEQAVKGEQSRQGTKDVVPREAFKNILEGDLGKQISELGGKTGEALDNTAKTIDEASNAVAEALEKEVNFRLQILSKQRQVEEQLIKQQEDRAQRLTSLRGGTTDPLAQARSSQAGQLSRLGFEGGDVSSISAARDKALKEQEAASKDVTAATQAGKDRLLELADEVARSTEALKILSDQSKTLAAIEAKAAELKRKEQLETAGIDQLVGDAVAAAQQGDPRALQELNASIAALDAAARGDATQQQAAVARQFAGTAAGQALLGGEEQAQALQSKLTDQFSGQLQQAFKGTAFAKGLEVLGKRREESRLGQKVQAEQFRAVAEQEQAAGRSSADITNAAIAAAESRAATDDPSQIFSNAVDSFAKAVGVFVAPPAPTPTSTPTPLAPGAIPTPSAPAVKGPSGIELAASPEKFGLAGQVGGAIGRGLGAASGAVSSLFQKGPKPEPPSQLDQIRQANRSRFEQEREAKKTGFRRQQLERREVAGTLDEKQTKELAKLRNPGEEIKKGSEEGANAFTQVFTAFAEKLPEQISAILEPVQIVGTDSMGEAIGKQLLPQIEQMIQSMINPNEGVPTPKAGAGT